MRISTIVIGIALSTTLSLPMSAQNTGTKLNPDKMIAELDANKDGCISRQEWAAGGLPDPIYSILEGQASKRDCVTAVELTKGDAPAGIDTDGDGYLSVAEMKAYTASHPAPDGPSGSSVPAAGGPGPGQPGGAPKTGGARFDEINQAVGLTPDQQTEVKAILQKSEDDVGALRIEMPTWNDQAKVAIDKIWAREKAAILAVLDAAQKPKYETYFKNWTDARAKDKH